MDKINRRKFLKKTTSLALGAVGFPYIVRSSALGKAGSIAPSNRIVMGCIGMGGQGTRGMAGGMWVPEGGGFIGRDDVKVVAVCDVNAKRCDNAREIVNKYYGNKDCRAYNDFRYLLARDDIDAVLIATGDRWHPFISIAAVKAGKDIYCEKPSSVTIAEARAMADAVKRYGCVYQVGTQQRSSYAFRFACELVRNGYIGEVKNAMIAVGRMSLHDGPVLPAEPVPEYLDYNMWLGPVQWMPYSRNLVSAWMTYRSCSGGELTNWGAHHFDIAQWGLGTEHTGPVEIIPPDGKDYKVLTLRYASGVTITRDEEGFLKQFGRDNGVVFTGTEGQVAVWRYEVHTKPKNLVRVKIKPDEVHLYKSDNHHNNFLRCVRTRQKPICDMEVGCRSITVCHLGNIAYQLNRPLKWNPEKEKFVNDDAANRMLSRPYRYPWRL